MAAPVSSRNPNVGPSVWPRGTEVLQTRDPVKAILEAAGSSLEKVVKASVFMTDLGEFAAMNEVYKERMPAPHPARTTIQAAALPGGIRVEIDVIALA